MLNYINDDQTAEFVYIIQALCEANNFTQDDIAQFGHVITLWQTKHRDKIKFVKQIPIHMLVPDEKNLSTGKIPPRAHTKQSFKRVRIDADANPSLPDPREYGLQEHSLKTESGEIRFWRCMTYRDYGPLGQVLHFVEKKNLKIFYKTILQLDREIVKVPPPVMDPGKLRDIYDNSIGFLKAGEENEEQYEKYSIPCKRGLLFAGEPGSGKTLSCKWLRSLCLEEGLDYKVVTYEIYRNALSRGSVANLFKLNSAKKGIIFFDDMDVFFQDRNTGNQHLMTFLTELDGIDPVDGIVFIFTSNKIGEDLDKAFVRPGRVDLFMKFGAPSKRLRKRFIQERFHEDILKYIDVDDFVERTGKQVNDESNKESNKEDNGYTFAELEEVRKLIVFEVVAGKTPDVDKIFKLFECHRKEFEEKVGKFGFRGLRDEEADEPDEDYYDFLNPDENPFKMP